MLFKSTLLLPALLALGLATAVPGPEVEEDLAARGADFGDNIAARGAEFGDNIAARDMEAEDLAARDIEAEDLAARDIEAEDLAARARTPDCGRFASFNSKQRRCVCRQFSFIYYDDGKICCPRDFSYDRRSRRCCRKRDFDSKRGRCR